MTSTTAAAAERPEGLMADLDSCARRVRRLPNTRALDVLDQMYAYHDLHAPVGHAATAFDSAA